MKPIYTIDAGEYLVGAEIEKKFQKQGIEIWIPGKDTGIDLLLRNELNNKVTGLQVKFSKDFNPTHVSKSLKSGIKSIGWFVVNQNKLQKSKADFWVFVLYNFGSKQHDYIVIEKSKLLSLYKSFSKKGNMIYIMITSNNDAFQTRGLNQKQVTQICSGNTSLFANRKLTKFLNNWKCVLNKL